MLAIIVRKIVAFVASTGIRTIGGVFMQSTIAITMKTSPVIAVPIIIRTFILGHFIHLLFSAKF